MKKIVRLPLLAMTPSTVPLDAKGQGFAELRVTVFDEPELSAVDRVDSEGAISFPLNDHIAAAGATIASRFF